MDSERMIAQLQQSLTAREMLIGELEKRLEQQTQATIARDRQLEAAERLAEALLPFAESYDGDLANVGGGTLLAPQLKCQAFKDAKAALAAFRAAKEATK